MYWDQDSDTHMDCHSVISRHMDESLVKQLIPIINQLFDLEKKVNKLEDGKIGLRNFRRMRASWTDLGLSYHDPTGEDYNETRTDCEASISGLSGENLFISETLKPIIRYQEVGFSKIVQRAVVIVSQKEAHS